MSDESFFIKEHSWLAKMASRKLKSKAAAIVLGDTIHIWGCTKADFLVDKRWLKHELCHIKQFNEHGYLPFIAKYLWEWMKVGYYNNKYEIEAREAEKV